MTPERFEPVERLAQRTFDVPLAAVVLDRGLLPKAPGMAVCAEQPILGPDGKVAGRLVLLDRVPHQFDAEQKRALRDLAGLAGERLAAPAGAGAEHARLLESLRRSPAHLAARRRFRVFLYGLIAALAITTGLSLNITRGLVSSADRLEAAAAAVPDAAGPLADLRANTRFFRTAVAGRGLLAVALLLALLALIDRWLDAGLSAQAVVELDRARLRAIIDGIADGVIVADARGRMSLFNPAAERILGSELVEADPGLWSRLYGIYLPDGVTPCPPERHPLARAVAGEGARDELFVVRNEKRPGGVEISVSAEPIRGSDGAPAGGVVIFRYAPEKA